MRLDVLRSIGHAQIAKELAIAAWSVALAALLVALAVVVGDESWPEGGEWGVILLTCYGGVCLVRVARWVTRLPPTLRRQWVRVGMAVGVAGVVLIVASIYDEWRDARPIQIQSDVVGGGLPLFPPDEPVDPTPVGKMSAGALWAEFSSNSIAAEREDGNRYIDVSGEVVSIRKGDYFGAVVAIGLGPNYAPYHRSMCT